MKFKLTDNQYQTFKWLITVVFPAITFNKELVDSYRNLLIEKLEKPTEGAYA